jgi:hypothetical protein
MRGRQEAEALRQHEQDKGAHADLRRLIADLQAAVELATGIDPDDQAMINSLEDRFEAINARLDALEAGQGAEVDLSQLEADILALQDVSHSRNRDTELRTEAGVEVSADQLHAMLQDYLQGNIGAGNGGQTGNSVVPAGDDAWQVVLDAVIADPGSGNVASPFASFEESQFFISKTPSLGGTDASSNAITALAVGDLVQFYTDSDRNINVTYTVTDVFDNGTWAEIRCGNPSKGWKDITNLANGDYLYVAFPQSGGGNVGHTIQDEDGKDLPQRSKLQATGIVKPVDDAANDRTILTTPDVGRVVTNASRSLVDQQGVNLPLANGIIEPIAFDNIIDETDSAPFHWNSAENRWDITKPCSVRLRVAVRIAADSVGRFETFGTRFQAATQTNEGYVLSVQEANQAYGSTPGISPVFQCNTGDYVFISAFTTDTGTWNPLPGHSWAELSVVGGDVVIPEAEPPRSRVHLDSVSEVSIGTAWTIEKIPLGLIGKQTDGFPATFDPALNRWVATRKFTGRLTAVISTGTDDVSDLSIFVDVYDSTGTRKAVYDIGAADVVNYSFAIVSGTSPLLDLEPGDYVEIWCFAAENFNLRWQPEWTWAELTQEGGKVALPMDAAMGLVLVSPTDLTDATVGGAVPFNVLDDDSQGISLENNQITIQAGSKGVLSGSPRVDFTGSNDEAYVRWYNVTRGEFVGASAALLANTASYSQGLSSHATCLVDATTGPQTFELRYTGINGTVTATFASASHAWFIPGGSVFTTGSAPLNQLDLGEFEFDGTVNSGSITLAQPVEELQLVFEAPPSGTTGELQIFFDGDTSAANYSSARYGSANGFVEAGESQSFGGSFRLGNELVSFARAHLRIAAGYQVNHVESFSQDSPGIPYARNIHAARETGGQTDFTTINLATPGFNPPAGTKVIARRYGASLS